MELREEKKNDFSCHLHTTCKESMRITYNNIYTFQELLAYIKYQLFLSDKNEFSKKYNNFPEMLVPL